MIKHLAIATCGCLLSSLSPAVTSAAQHVVEQEDILSAEAIEANIEAILPSCLEAIVCLRHGGDSTGTIVSPDGLILSAGHVIVESGRTFRVILADGREVEGVSLGANLSQDIGLIRITTPSDTPWPHVPLAEAVPDTETWCLTMGHPGGYTEGTPPQVRLGRTWARRQLVLDGVDDDAYEMLMTDAIMQPGDSGGPLFNLEGELIGTHSGVSFHTFYNRHPAVDAIHRDWDRMIAGEVWGTPETGVMLAGTHATIDNAAIERMQQELMQLVEAGDPEYTAALQPYMDADGSVELSVQQLVDIFGIEAERVAYNEPLSHRRNQPGLMAELDAAAPDGSCAIILANDERLCLGTCVANGFILTKLSEIQADTHGLFEIRHGNHRTTATLASCDENLDLALLALDEQAALTPVSISESNAVTGHILVCADEAGGVLAWGVTSDAPRQSTRGTIGPVPGDNEGVSAHRGPFPMAQTFDARLLPDQIGGPVYNARGECVGISLARQRRVSSLLLPATAFLNATNALLEEARETD